MVLGIELFPAVLDAMREGWTCSARFLGFDRFLLFFVLLLFSSGFSLHWVFKHACAIVEHISLAAYSYISISGNLFSGFTIPASPLSLKTLP